MGLVGLVGLAGLGVAGLAGPGLQEQTLNTRLKGTMSGNNLHKEY